MLTGGFAQGINIFGYFYAYYFPFSDYYRII